MGLGKLQVFAQYLHKQRVGCKSRSCGLPLTVSCTCTGCLVVEGGGAKSGPNMGVPKSALARLNLRRENTASAIPFHSRRKGASEPISI
jgi:hypothetical protein